MLEKIEKNFIKFVDVGQVTEKSIISKVGEFSAMNMLPLSELYNTLAIYYSVCNNNKLASFCIEQRDRIEKFYQNHGGNPE